MDRARLLALPLVVAIGLAAAIAACGQEPAGSVRLATTGQGDLLAQRSLAVRLSAETTDPTVLQAVIERGGQQRAISRAETVPANAREAELRIERSGEAHLRSCEAASLTIRARQGDDDWQEVGRAPLVRQPPTCGRFFAHTGHWNRELPDDAPIDPRSKAIVGDLLRQVRRDASRNYGPTMSYWQYSAPIYVVGPDQPAVPVILDRDESWARDLKRIFAAGAPIPAGARPAKGTDGHMVVWQPSTDTMWEFFVARRDRDGWHASWGGRMDDASRNPGVFTAVGYKPGATATSLPLVGGLMTLEELDRGRIEHALALALPEARASVWARPAQRTDGHVVAPDSVPEGARFRLDPDVDVERLPVPPLVKAMARAAQRYGIVVRDKAGAVTFYGETPRRGRVDPYERVFGGRTPVEVLRGFPWERLQLVRMELERN